MTTTTTTTDKPDFDVREQVVAWLGTLNNYTQDEKDTMESFLATQCKWGIVGFEVGKKGTPHLQFAFILKKKKRLSELKVSFGRANFRHMDGTPEQNRVYCSKEPGFKEFGKIPDNNGKREKIRWQKIREDAVAGNWDAIPAQVLIQYYPGVKGINKDFAKRPRDLDGELAHIWISGASGSGKSRLARDICNNGYTIPGNNIVIEPADYYSKFLHKWWDGYQQEPIVIIDDWSPRQAAELEDHIKLWTDRYAFRCEYKGGSMWARPKVVIVTSQYSLENCFTDEQTVEALKRRFNQIRVGPEPGASVPLFVPPTPPPRLDRQVAQPPTPRPTAESRKRQKEEEVIEIEEDKTEEEDVDPDDEDPDIIVKPWHRMEFQHAAKLWKKEFANGLDGMKNRGYKAMIAQSTAGNPLAKDWVASWRMDQVSQEIDDEE